MDTSYKPYYKTTYSCTTSYSTSYRIGRFPPVYITYDRDGTPKPERELEIGDTKPLDEFLQGFGVKQV